MEHKWLLASSQKSCTYFTRTSRNKNFSRLSILGKLLHKMISVLLSKLTKKLVNCIYKRRFETKKNFAEILFKLFEII